MGRKLGAGRTGWGGFLLNCRGDTLKTLSFSSDKKQGGVFLYTCTGRNCLWLLCSVWTAMHASRLVFPFSPVNDFLLIKEMLLGNNRNSFICIRNSVVF